MSNGSVKAINILSYILNVVLVLALLFILKPGKDTQRNNNTALINDIKSVIVHQERVQLPMTIQKLSDVNDVKIDSLVLTNNVEPYQGYMVTQWNYNTYRKKNIQKQVLVEVTDITCTKEQVTWNSNWLGAMLSLL